jgi:hypothetical protein
MDCSPLAAKRASSSEALASQLAGQLGDGKVAQGEVAQFAKALYDNVPHKGSAPKVRIPETAGLVGCETARNLRCDVQENYVLLSMLAV